MPQISVGWTLPALLAGAKTVTRQAWKREPGWLRAGRVVTIYTPGMTTAATIRLTADPRLEPLRAMPDSDYEAEGWPWLHAHPEALGRYARREDVSWAAFERWRARPYSTWVVRFEVCAVAGARVTPTGRRNRAARGLQWARACPRSRGCRTR
jgi:hypothetical protein